MVEESVIDMPTTEVAEVERRLFDRYRIDARSTFVQLRRPDLRTRVVEVGEGPPVLFVHGTCASASVWTPLLASLTGYRLLAVDRPGCVYSEPFDYQDVDLRAHSVDFLVSLLDTLELERVAIVGNSMGGLWSFWLALEHPERVSAISLLGCPALLLDTSAPLAMRLLSLPAIHVRPVVGSHRGRSMMRSVVGPTAFERMPEELIDCIEQTEALWSRGTRLSLIQRALSPVGARADSGLDIHELARVQHPTLFVWGEQDGFGHPAVGRRACLAMPAASIEVLQAGHLPWLDQPARVGDLLMAFLRAHHLGGP
jgi:2-hydroxy-6-oxonona-2,4-dienedioate hydrolase